MCVSEYTMVCVKRSEDNVQGLLLSVISVTGVELARVIRPGSRCLFPLSLHSVDFRAAVQAHSTVLDFTGLTQSHGNLLLSFAIWAVNAVPQFVDER